MTGSSGSTIRERPPRSRRTTTSRRGGYVGAIVVNAIMLYLINVWPGWAVLPFLTVDLSVVLPWINASILTSIVVNLGYLVADPRWLRALGSIVTGAVGLVAIVRMWQVFPFDFAGSAIDWTVPVRVALALGIAGAVVGIAVAVVMFVRAVLGVGAESG